MWTLSKNQATQASALTLVTNAIIVWNTRYMRSEEVIQSTAGTGADDYFQGEEPVDASLGISQSSGGPSASRGSWFH